MITNFFEKIGFKKKSIQKQEIPKIIRWKDDFIDPKESVLVFGESAVGAIKFDLNKFSHIAIAGDTGSGKSVILRCMLWQMIQKGCSVYMSDFKWGEFDKKYEQFGEVILERQRALEVFEMLVAENDRRLALFRELYVKNLIEYNKLTGANMRRICVFCDSIINMLCPASDLKHEKEICDKLHAALSKIARLAGHGVGINLFLNIERPHRVYNGALRNCTAMRILGRSFDKSHAEILAGNAAESVLNLPEIPGRFIFRFENEAVEFQSYYFDDTKDLRGNYDY